MSKKSNKAINSTIILYIRMFFTTLIGFFTIRIVLKALGEIDYGIYSLVGGVVATLAFLDSVLSNSTTRFLSYSLGKNDEEEVRKTFRAAIFLHIFLGILLVIIMELGGWIMFRSLLNIPPERLYAAKWVFHLMVLNVYVNVISTPYDALIISHEDFFQLSVIDVAGLLLKLFFVLYLLQYPSDKLILYSVLMFSATLILRITKQIFSRIKYKKILIKTKMGIDKRLLRSMLNFSSWILFGTLCSIGSDQISGIIINMFFGVRLNAANGIGFQVRNQINTFSANLTRAIMPQLMKSEGSGNREKMLELTGVSTKFAIYFFAFFAIPIIFETTILLKLWIVNVPEYTVIFCRLFLIGLLLDKFTFHLGDAIRAVGVIKWYQITESLIILLNLPISFLLFRKGYPPQTIYIVPFILHIIIIGLRFYFAHTITGLDVRVYLSTIVTKAMYPILCSVFILLLVKVNISEGIFRLFISFLSSSISFVMIVILFGLTVKEKQIIMNYVLQKLKR
jgi:O-antigen/teichoic acid export membrane protein